MQSQAQVGERMGITAAAVSRMESSSTMQVQALLHYIEALGGECEIVVRFPDREFSLQLKKKKEG
jgi:transcriptional regulator with XRE-family HTH domain